MLSSLILTLAMSATPVTVNNINTVVTEEVGTKRGMVRINHELLDTTEIGTKRGMVRIGTKRGMVRI